MGGRPHGPTARAAVQPPSPLPSTELVRAALVSRGCFSLPSLHQRSEVPGTTGTTERPARAGSFPPGSSPLSLPPNSPTLLAWFTLHQPSLQGKHGSEREELSPSSWRSWSHLGQPGTRVLSYSQCAARYGLLLQPGNTNFHQNPQNIYRRWIHKEGWTRQRLHRSRQLQGKLLPKRGRLCWDLAGGSPLLHDVVELVAGLVVLQPVDGAPFALPVCFPELPDKHLRGEGEARGSAGKDEPRAAPRTPLQGVRVG